MCDNPRGSTDYERGLFLRQDYYNGINLAFLLNVRAVEHHNAGTADEAIADFVLARRVRRDVNVYCRRALEIATNTEDDRYWVVATLWEAAMGLGDADGVTTWKKEAESMRVASWMLDSTRSQLGKLEQLLAASRLRVLRPS